VAARVDALGARARRGATSNLKHLREPMFKHENL
jgi:hypothetical protein